MIRVGLVGCGHIGAAHALAITELAAAGLVDAGLVAVADRDPARAERFAARYGAVAHATPGDLVDAVDVVWICTWTSGHRALAELAADRGRAVFCEKPLGTDLAEAEQVAAALRAVPHQVGLVLRSAPVFVELRRRIASGEHGRVLAVAFRDDQYFPVQGTYRSSWRGEVEHAGGGTLLEHSIHDVDLLRWMLGEPERVNATVESRFGHPGIDDVAAVSFRFPGGATAQLTSVWHQVTARESSRRLEVFCEDALLWTDDDNLGPLRVERADGTEVVAGEGPVWTDRLGVPPAHRAALALYSAPTKAFLDGLAGGIPGSPSADEALAAHRIVAAAYRSAAAGGTPVTAEGA
ncbi:MAG: Gfo/Idh/MocA family protein [Actinomycetota bacterium]